GSLRITKKHHVKQITTRKYYPGKQKLDIQVNGVSQGSLEWILSLKPKTEQGRSKAKSGRSAS
ncbi:MAG: hypothetical protein V4692_15750, partial [Bdellovibrionota bacterium]